MRMKPADWDLVLNINLNGAFRCIQQVLPTMMRSRWGRIINIASVVGQAGAAGQANYPPSKGRLRATTKALGHASENREGTAKPLSPRHLETAMHPDLPREKQP